MNVHAIVNSSVGSHTSLPVAEHSSEIEIGGLSVDSRQQAAFIEQNPPSSAVHLENYFTSGSPLCPEELLIYSLMKMQFKNSTFTRHHTMVKYEKIAEVVSKICGVQFEPHAIRRFFPRISNNKLNSSVGKENGRVRWRYFGRQVEEFICVSGKDLKEMLDSSKTAKEDIIVRTSDQLRRICSTEMFHPIAHTPNFSNQFVKLVKPQISTPPQIQLGPMVCYLDKYLPRLLFQRVSRVCNNRNPNTANWRMDILLPPD